MKIKIHTIKTVNPYFTLARDEVKGFEPFKNFRITLSVTVVF